MKLTKLIGLILILFATSSFAHDLTNTENTTRSTFTDIFPESLLSGTLILDDFSPKQGGIGSEVIITGEGFTDVTSVEFRGVLTNFIIINDTAISAVVPIGMTQPGRIRIKIDTPFQKVVSTIDFTPVAMTLTDFYPKKAGVTAVNPYPVINTSLPIPPCLREKS
jgi:hypothetical protein